jgi:hypothetical protein
VAEIYELSNDTILTRVAGDEGAPLWSAIVPAGVADFSSGPEMLSNEAITLTSGRVTAFAPIAPGLKRIAFTYSLPPEAFPLSMPVEQATDVLEVLIEDREGEVIGPGLEETAPSNIEGHMFRRFQVQNIAAASVITVRLPTASIARRATSPWLIAAVAMLMVGALVVALRRSRSRARPVVVVPASPSHVMIESDANALAREIAELDAAFEASSPADATARTRYEELRARLKHRLAERLAAHRGP